MPLPQLLALRSDAPLTGADDALRAEILKERENLSNFYTAGLAAYSGDRQRWTESMQQVLAADGKNPYYSWLVGR